MAINKTLRVALYRWVALLAIMPSLAGCDLVVMSPSGDVASQQADLIIYSTMLMLIVILPVIALTFFFAYHYRASNENATYEPDWEHSIALEIVVWSLPLAIIICLAGLTWVSTHRLNPYEPIKRISENKPVPKDVKPLVIQAVAMDWKWVFLYPDQGIATVNEVSAIVDRPIEFQITSTSVMNAMYIPALAGMIYAMPGMQTELNAVINRAGTYDGLSSNYSGAGFSKMRFKFHGMLPADFDAWTEKVHQQGESLDLKKLGELQKPTIAHPVTYFQISGKDLWDRLVNNCVGPDKLCVHDLMIVDAFGGGGLEGLWNRQRYKDMCAKTNSRDPRWLLPDGASDARKAVLSLLPQSSKTQSSKPPIRQSASAVTAYSSR